MMPLLRNISMAAIRVFGRLPDTAPHRGDVQIPHGRFGRIDRPAPGGKRKDGKT